MKNVVILFLIVLCGFLAWKVFFSPPVTIIKKETPIAKAGKDLVSAEVDNINKKVNQQGFERALFEDKNSLGKDDELDSASQAYIDSVLHVNGIQKKQLTFYQSLTATLQDSLLKATNFGDSLYTYSDGLAKISFNRPDETFSFKYDAKIEHAEYWDRTWFLGKKRHYVELWIPDKRATINGVQRLRIEPKPDNFDLTLNGSAQYHLNEIGIGGKVNLRIGRMTGSGSYLYYPNYSEWKPSFSLDYEIGGF